MQVITSQGAQIYDVFASGRGGATAALREFGAVAAEALFAPIGAAELRSRRRSPLSAVRLSKAQKRLAELRTRSPAIRVFPRRLYRAARLSAPASVWTKRRRSPRSAMRASNEHVLAQQRIRALDPATG